MSDELSLILKSLFIRARRSSTERTDGYKAFTREFDIIVDANDLDKAIGQIDPGTAVARDEAWAAFSEGLAGWKTRIALTALESSERVRKAISQESRENTLVSLLVDLSGSMKGQKILLAAAAVDSAQDYLGGLGLRSEILGFTTRAWRGGRPWRVWHLSGRASNPGRLNELLHVIFKTATDDRRSIDGPAIKQMLRPQLLKENIDGEAIEWAVERLRAYPAERRCLIIISDGAPVDDATITANGTSYLIDHLREVIARLKEDGDIEIAALGIGYAVSRYYEKSAEIDTPEEIGSNLIQLLERSLIRS